MARVPREVLLSHLGVFTLRISDRGLTTRFNRLAWSAPTTSHSKGLIAAGMETGEVHVYDPEKIMAGKRYDKLQ
jgi:hypothetical protein